MAVENLMHPHQKCNCQCQCHYGPPATYGPLPDNGKFEFSPEVKRKMAEVFTGQGNGHQGLEGYLDSMG